MKLLAAALLALQVQPASAQAAPVQAAPAPPSAALIDRFIAVIPDWKEISGTEGEIDSTELSTLLALNPGKEAKLRPILKANLACTVPAINAGTVRMLRTVARNLGEDRLQKLIGFYEGPDYAAFKALATRMEGNPAPSEEDKAALARLMAAYPLQAFLDQMNRAGEIIAADKAFIAAATKCASEQSAALEAAGLRH